MALTNTEKKNILSEYKKNEEDTGSSKVQIALLTADIKNLTEHFKLNKHDFHSRIGLTKKINKRRKLLLYLKRTSTTHYFDLIKLLKLRDTIS